MFDSEFMKKLEYLSLISRRIFRGQLLAQKRTRQMGGGVEFADHRDYVLGDDLRYLDWNVYARLGSELIKRFEEEEDLHVYFFLDCSQSMSMGHPNKFDYARQITAALAYIALADLDRISVVAFAGQIYDIFPLIRGKQHILSLLRFLESLQTVGETTDLLASVNEFLHRKQRTGLAVVISDLFDPAGFQKAIDTLRYRRFEPNVIQVHDELEASPKLLGDLQLLDIETGFVRNVTISESVLRRYKQKFAGFLDSVKKYCTGHGFSCTISTTAVPFDEMILRMMREAGSVR
ncbi:MAG: DUF58 domain-containing protein [Planctomycetaceae bacterium]|jgi:uncharacterized protein (DUF58 family)|nr:DUF58 domain-containing protein [Planctomycetaceae bacterium]